MVLALPAAAQEKVVHNGVEGVWYELTAAEALVKRFEVQQDVIDTQDQLLNVYRANAVTASRTITLLEDANAREAEFAEVGWKSYQDEVKRNAAWYNQPVVWVVVGVVVGGATAAAVAAVVGD